jgi:hypothetical protein
VTASPASSQASTSPLMTPRTEQFLETLITPRTSPLMTPRRTSPVAGPSSLAAVAAAHKVPAPKIKVQERSGMLQSLLDLSKQELSRFSPLRTPPRRVLPVMKLIRRQDNQWRRVPV